MLLFKSLSLHYTKWYISTVLLYTASKTAKQMVQNQSGFLAAPDTTEAIGFHHSNVPKTSTGKAKTEKLIIGEAYFARRLRKLVLFSSILVHTAQSLTFSYSFKLLSMHP